MDVVGVGVGVGVGVRVGGAYALQTILLHVKRSNKTESPNFVFFMFTEHDIACDFHV